MSRLRSVMSDSAKFDWTPNLLQTNLHLNVPPAQFRLFGVQLYRFAKNWFRTEHETKCSPYASNFDICVVLNMMLSNWAYPIHAWCHYSLSFTSVVLLFSSFISCFFRNMFSTRPSEWFFIQYKHRNRATSIGTLRISTFRFVFGSSHVLVSAIPWRNLNATSFKHFLMLTKHFASDDVITCSFLHILILHGSFVVRTLESYIICDKRALKITTII